MPAQIIRDTNSQDIEQENRERSPSLSSENQETVIRKGNERNLDANEGDQHGEKLDSELLKKKRSKDTKSLS